MKTTTVDMQIQSQQAQAESRLRDFYELTKPRMNFLVVITTAVGYYMAARSMSDWAHLIHTLIGTMLCASCAAVFNQWMEVEYDRQMPRTQNRPLVCGRIGMSEAILFGSLLGLVGLIYLALCVNALTAMLGLATIASYLFVYTPLKRYSSLNTVVGAVPGAIPPLMGFTAVQDALSPAAIALFAVLFLWQMPHFLAIAILYRDDYAKGGFKMLPVIDPGLNLTMRMILLYSVALVPVTLMPAVIGIAGQIYFVSAMLLGLAFLSFGITLMTTRERVDARKLFFASISYLPLLLGVMMWDKVV